MKFKYLHKTFLLAAAVLAASASVCSADLKVDYAYNLSNFEGILPFNWANMFLDKNQDEIYVCDSTRISIFNSSGMEVYTFGDDNQLGSVASGAVDEDGNLLLLTAYYQNGKLAGGLMLCNYRGEPISKVTYKDVPKEFGYFNAEQVVYHDRKLYLADLVTMKVLVVDKTGKYLDSYDIASIMKLTPQQVADSGMTGFNVDKDGNIYFTIAVNFHAYKMTTDRQITSFGTAGSAPGRFSVVTGIATDDNGNIYVVDTLKAAVLVFDRNFKFLTEFGGRGYGPGDMIAPRGIVIDAKGKVYVTQSASRGVNVYRISS